MEACLKMYVGRQKKLAKELLRTVPAAQKPSKAVSIRGALITAFMKPENVIGALVYTDGNGNWWGDVVLNKGKKYLQMGSEEEAPLRSYDDAYEHVKAVIAAIKAQREHPLVEEFFRKNGFDPERVELLASDTKSSATDGCLWMTTKCGREPKHSWHMSRTNSRV